MESNRHIIASIFLIVFSFMQLADLHIVGHDMDDSDCSICALSSEGIDDDFSTIDIVEIPNTIQIPLDTNTIDYKDQYISSHCNFSFLNKAPPAA